MKKLLKKLLYNQKSSGVLLRFFLRLHGFSYCQISKLAVISSAGVHPKHEIMKYYKFFSDNISRDDYVLDVGCGNGYVAQKVATKAKNIVGIDISKENILFAKKNHKKKNLSFIEGDALSYDFGNKFDVIILSNVLEHIEDREEFLAKLSEIAPKILVRVPLITRDWLASYKKEKGLDYKLDKTHFIEYQEEEFFDEIKKVELIIDSYHIKWGELYAVCSVNNKINEID